MHHQTDPGLARGFDDGDAFVPGRRERLLADDGNAAGGRESHHLEVGLGRRDDIDEVGLFLVEYGGEIVPGSDAGNTVAGGGLLRAVQLAVDDRHDLDAGNAAPRFVLEAAEIAGAKADTAQAA
jgi:hypothetical protein